MSETLEPPNITTNNTNINFYITSGGMTERDKYPNSDMSQRDFISTKASFMNPQSKLSSGSKKKKVHIQPIHLANPSETAYSSAGFQMPSPRVSTAQPQKAFRIKTVEERL
jgi:hypothetical protein